MLFLKEMQKLPEAVQLIEKASMMYLENGTPDTAAMALERAGKWVHTTVVGCPSLAEDFFVLLKSFKKQVSYSHKLYYLSNSGS